MAYLALASDSLMVWLSFLLTCSSRDLTRLPRLQVCMTHSRRTLPQTQTEAHSLFFLQAETTYPATGGEGVTILLLFL